MTGPIRILELRSVRGTGGGPEKTILLGAAQADARRFAITVCYMRSDRDDIFAIDARARQLGVDYVEILERSSFDPRMWPALTSIIRDRHIQIVHAHDYKTDFLAWILARTSAVKVMSTVHGWAGRTFRERYIYYPADRWLLASFPLLVAVSSKIRATLIRSGARPERIRTVLNAIDETVFRREPQRRGLVRASLGFTNEHLVVGAVGSLLPVKRFDLLIAAVATLVRSRPAIRLVIAGTGGLLEDLQDQARRTLPAGVCSFLGQRLDVADLHNAFDVFVQSSDSEGTPNAVLEAMALETPIVATAVGGTDELVADGVHGLLVPPRNTQALAAAIERTFADPVGTAQRVRTARSRVEHDLSFSARRRTLESLYEELASSTRPGEPREGHESWVSA